MQSAVCLEVHRLTALRQHQGFESSTSAAGVSKNYNLNFVPDEYKQTVAKYKRYV
jgi:hypothetical protein